MDKVTDNTTGFYFTIIDNYILNSAGLNALEQIVYIHLKQYSVQTNKCFTGINKIADSIDVSSNTVRKVLKSLKEKGYLDIHQRFNKSNEYTLLPYPGYAESEDTEETFTEGTGSEGNGNDRQGREGTSCERPCSGIAMVLQSYRNNINPVYGSMERDKLISWLDTFEGNGDILVKAIEMAVLQGVRKMKYIESVLINWHQCGIKTIEQCEAFLKEREEKRRESKNGTGHSVKDSGVCEEIQNRYDFSKFNEL